MRLDEDMILGWYGDIYCSRQRAFIPNEDEATYQRVHVALAGFIIERPFLGGLESYNGWAARHAVLLKQVIYV